MIVANIIDYVEHYGKKTFEEVPFNDVDALVLAQLSYLPISIDIKKKLPLTIHKVAEDYFKTVSSADMKKRIRLYREVYHLWETLYQTKRYKNLMITNYVKVIDETKQFGAVTFRDKKWIYISFEGTDDSISGWKEDFSISHIYPLPSQTLAISYLEDEVRFLDKTVYVGGHSKGGNLALVASLEASAFVRHRLKTIYNFDGPGLREKEYHSLKYKKIANKLKMFVPGESIVGMILHHDMNYEVVKSSASRLWQHDGFSWECFGGVFVNTTLSKKSITFSREMRNFLKTISDSEREEFVSAIFLILQKAGITSTEKVTFSKLLICLSLIGDLIHNAKMRDKLKKIFSMLLAVYKP